MSAYVVVAPMVYLKVPSNLGLGRGGYTLATFYRDSIVPAGVHPDSLQHHLDNGMVVDTRPKGA